MAEKISVITISYNSIKTIEKTFESILNQKYRPLEYVLVDGGSTDGTLELIESYIPKFSKAGIEVNFKSERDNGISDAFNKGVMRATGDIIGITNSDDVILDGTLEYVANNFPKTIDVFYGDCLWKDPERKIEYVRKSSRDLRDLKIRLKILHPATYIRKTAYAKYGLYDVSFRFCMDKELLARIQRLGGTFLYVERTLVAVTAGGASDKNLRGVNQEGERIAISNGVSKLRAKWIYNTNYLIVKLKNQVKEIPCAARLIEIVKR